MNMRDLILREMVAAMQDYDFDGSLPDRNQIEQWAMALANMDALIWMPIDQAPKDGTPLWLYSPTFEDLDFNPTGVVDGFWMDEYGWTIWLWDGCQDEYETVRTHPSPTHFAYKFGPNRKGP